MNTTAGMFLGAGATFGAVAVVGTIWGGISGAAPCHSAPDFATGAVFGGLLTVWALGIPALLAGAVLGGVGVKLARRDRGPRDPAGAGAAPGGRATARGLMTLVAVFAVLLAATRWLNP